MPFYLVLENTGTEEEPCIFLTTEHHEPKSNEGMLMFQEVKWFPRDDDGPAVLEVLAYKESCTQEFADLLKTAFNMGRQFQQDHPNTPMLEIESM